MLTEDQQCDTHLDSLKREDNTWVLTWAAVYLMGETHSSCTFSDNHLILCESILLAYNHDHLERRDWGRDGSGGMLGLSVPSHQAFVSLIWTQYRQHISNNSHAINTTLIFIQDELCPGKCTCLLNARHKKGCGCSNLCKTKLSREYSFTIYFTALALSCGLFNQGLYLSIFFED